MQAGLAVQTSAVCTAVLWFGLDNQQCFAWTKPGIQEDGTYRQQAELKKLPPSDDIIIIDGTYSASPAIIDLVDISILIDAPIAERHKRLANREDAAFLKEWHQQWDDVEDYYLTEIRPKEFYDLVIHNH